MGKTFAVAKYFGRDKLLRAKGILVKLFDFHANFSLAVEHPCLHEENGGCSHLCFHTPTGGNTCACPDGMTMNNDGKTCRAPPTTATTTAPITTVIKTTAPVEATTQVEATTTLPPITVVKPTPARKEEPSTKATKETESREEKDKIQPKHHEAEEEKEDKEEEEEEEVVGPSVQEPDDIYDASSSDEEASVGDMKLVVGILCPAVIVLFVVMGVLCYRRKKNHFDLRYVVRLFNFTSKSIRQLSPSE